MLADGLPVERYAGPEGTGLLFPDDGACNPMRRLRRLARRVIADGAMLHEQTHAVSFSAGRVRTSTGASVRAAHIFVCVDGRLLQCFPHLHPHVRTVRLQMVASAPDVSVHIPRPMYANYAFDYWQQLPDHSVVLGAGRDRFGAAEDTEDDTPTAELQAHLDDLLRRRVGVQTLVTHRWAASVCYTRDYLPIVREVVPGTWAIGAYSGTGNLVGAMCARGAVRRALGVPDPFVDLLTSLAAL
jgi:glycine/D-amino acid oxidase-like deaminating enzyme